MTLAQILQLLTTISTLEPVAINLILALAQSLSGKTPAQIQAMNDALFAQIQQNAAAEIASLPVAPVPIPG